MMHARVGRNMCSCGLPFQIARRGVQTSMSAAKLEDGCCSNPVELFTKHALDLGLVYAADIKCFQTTGFPA